MLHRVLSIEFAHITSMSVNLAVLEPATPLRGSNKGAEIPAKIAANRVKRLRIADAMKKEAGVTEHTVHREDFGGVAYIGTGRIYSPQGRKIVPLYTLAHLRLPLGIGPTGARPGCARGEARLRACLVAGDSGLRARHLGASRPHSRAHAAHRHWFGGANSELSPSGGASIRHRHARAHRTGPPDGGIRHTAAIQA
jgi:hypothetical protein